MLMSSEYSTAHAAQLPFWGSALKQAAREATASAGAGITVDSVFYSLDSYKTHAQSAGGTRHFGLKEFRGLFRGFLPVVATGTAPSFAVFFSLYEPLKLSLQRDGRAAQNSAAVLATSGLCAIPASIVAVPSDVLKKRVVLGLETDAKSAIQNIYNAGGVGGFFVGWRANVLKDVPFAAVKMCLYEGSVALYMRMRGYPPGTPVKSLENAGLGMVSGAITGVMTCPLDVVNTRLKSMSLAALPRGSSPSVLSCGRKILVEEGLSALFRGLVPRVIIISLGSSMFWPAYHRIKLASEDRWL